MPVVDAVLAAHLGTLALDGDDFGAQGAPHLTGVRWPASGTGAGGAVLRFSAIDGLGYRYLRGSGNPAGFAAARGLWALFTGPPAPVNGRRRGLPDLEALAGEAADVVA